MKTFTITVLPGVKVTKGKKNGKWRERFKVTVPEELTQQDVEAVLKGYIKSNYTLRVSPERPDDWSTFNLEPITLTEAKESLKNVELYYCKEELKASMEGTTTTCKLKIPSLFKVDFVERPCKHRRIGFFNTTSSIREVKYNSECLIEQLESYGIDCGIAVNGTAYIKTSYNADSSNFKLTKTGKHTYELKVTEIKITYKKETTNVPF